MLFVTPINDSVGEVLDKHMGLVSIPLILHPISLASLQDLFAYPNVSLPVLWQD